MTTPAYTPAAARDRSHGAGRLGSLRAWVRSGLDRTGALAESLAGSKSLPVAMDLAAILFIALVFANTDLPADFLFHCAFVILTLHAFLFGLRGTLLRIGLVSVPLTVYAFGDALGLDFPPFELAEWPLMLVIALLVAWMAERRNSTSHRYAILFRTASERLQIVEDAERRRIASELHDGVGQIMTALTLNLDAARSLDAPAEVRDRLSAARALADQALAGTRDLAHRMRPTRLEERGLIGALRDLAGQSGFPVTVHVEPSAEVVARLDEATAIEVFRIVQESLANAARHSGADSARVEVASSHDRLSVVVSDDGSGFDQQRAAGAGIGLSGMRERARLVDGQLSIATAPNAGTRVSISVPLHASQVSGQ